MAGGGAPRFVFDSTNAVLWAEDVAREAGIPVEVVPAPAESRARCDLALATTPGAAPRLTEVLTASGISHRRWPSG